MAHQSVLQTLLGKGDVRQFLEDHYLRFPYAGSGGVSDCLHPMNADTLIGEAFEGKNLDLIIGREGRLRAAAHAIAPAEISSLLAEGQTIGLRHVQLNHHGMAEWAERLRGELWGAVDVHLYWTPAGHPGFGWHYDAEEVFILQLRGTKTWRLRKNTVNPWPLLEAIPKDQRFDREIMPVKRIELTTGNWLYIPGGYWHATNASEESVSLSVGVRAATAIDVLSLIRNHLAQQIEWRERLLCGSPAAAWTASQVEDHYIQLLARLSSSLHTALKDPGFLRAVVAHFHPTVYGLTTTAESE